MQALEIVRVDIKSSGYWWAYKNDYKLVIIEGQVLINIQNRERWLTCECQLRLQLRQTSEVSFQP